MSVKTVSRTAPWTKVILGQPYSKANSRKMATIRGVPRLIKSKEALSYLDAFVIQCPILNPMFEGNVHVEMEIYYSSNRPDLDESLVLDALQGRVYRNDRQVWRKTIQKAIDRDAPRVVIRVSPLEERPRTIDP